MFSPGHLSTLPALAWNTSLAVIALEKLTKSRAVNEEEKAALERLSKTFNALSKASQILGQNYPEPRGSALAPEVLDGFLTLTALEEKNRPSFDAARLDQAESCLIAAQNCPSRLDRGDVRRTQEICLELLEHLDSLRPAPRSI